MPSPVKRVEDSDVSKPCEGESEAATKSPPEIPILEEPKSPSKTDEIAATPKSPPKVPILEELKSLSKTDEISTGKCEIQTSDSQISTEEPSAKGVGAAIEEPVEELEKDISTEKTKESSEKSEENVPEIKAPEQPITVLDSSQVRDSTGAKGHESKDTEEREEEVIKKIVEYFTSQITLDTTINIAPTGEEGASVKSDMEEDRTARLPSPTGQNGKGTFSPTRTSPKKCSSTIPEKSPETIQEPSEEPVSEADLIAASQLAADEANAIINQLENREVSFSCEDLRKQVGERVEEKLKEERETVLYGGQTKRPIEISAAPSSTAKRNDPKIAVADNKFAINIDVSLYDKECISINIVGDKIDIYCNQTVVNEFGEQFHELHQVYIIPSYVDDSAFTAYIDENKMLFLVAPLKKCDKLTSL